MTPDAVVEDFDVFEQAGPCLLPRCEDLASSQLLLQTGEKALHRRVIPAVRPPAHTARDPVAGQKPSVVLARVLAAPVRVSDKPLTRQASGDRHLQGIDDQA